MQSSATSLLAGMALSIALATDAVLLQRAAHAFLLSWLANVAFLLSIALGTLLLDAMFALGGSRLHAALRDAVVVTARCLPLVLLACVPLVLGAQRLYFWTDGRADSQAAYLNAPFALARLLAYFAAWLGAARCALAPARAWRCAAMMLVLLLSMSCAAFDAFAALWPRWHSAALGLRWCVDALLAAAAAVVLSTEQHALRDENQARTRADVGNLLLALNLGWLYLVFVDYATAWSGNLPDEAAWYLPRLAGWWGAAGALLVAVHVSGAALLLSRTLKQRPAFLRTMAALLLAAQWLESFWMVMPGRQVPPFPAALAAIMTLVALLAACMLWQRIAPRNDRSAGVSRHA